MKQLCEFFLACALGLFICAGAYPAAKTDAVKPATAGTATEKSGRPRKHDKISYRVAASQAVLGYLLNQGKETLEAALRTCLSVRERLPDDAFAGFLAAFCRHESGDAAGEAAILSAYPAVQRDMYRFFFYERRGELAGALQVIPAYLCKHLRELPNAADTFPAGTKCPGFGGPVTKETCRKGGRTHTRFLCPKCDGMIQRLKDGRGGAARDDDSLCPILFHVAYKFLDSKWRFTTKEYGGVKGFLSILGVREGQVVADIGCGNGQFTFPFAEKVGPAGKVYAEEIDARELELIRYCIEKGGIKNVVPVLGAPADVKIPAAELDTAFLINVYRTILLGMDGAAPGQRESFFDAFFSGIRKALKEDGELVVVDRIDPRFGVTAKETAAALKKRGFRLAADKSDLKDRTMILFFKKAGPGGK